MKWISANERLPDDMDDFAMYHWRYAADHFKLDTDLFENDTASKELHKKNGEGIAPYEEIEWLDESCAQQETESLRAEMETYKKLNSDLILTFDGLKNEIAELEEEARQGRIAESQLIIADQEILRLRVLVKNAFTKDRQTTLQDEKLWQKFKEENNL